MITRIITIIMAVLFLMPNYTWAHGSAKKKVNFLNKADTAPDFTLIDQDGKTITLKDYKGRLVFITFFHSKCIKACPLILQNRQRMQESIEKGIGRKGLVFMAITVDPDVDKPEILKDYVKTLEMNPKDLHLLTGEHEVIEKVLANYGIKYKKGSESGQIDHSIVGYVINGVGIIDKRIKFKF